jgi:hypothetical protein
LYASKAESRYSGANTAIFCFALVFCANKFVSEKKNNKGINNASFNLTLLSLSEGEGGQA